jgi:hypothetical protein
VCVCVCVSVLGGGKVQEKRFAPEPLAQELSGRFKPPLLQINLERPFTPRLNLVSRPKSPLLKDANTTTAFP